MDYEYRRAFGQIPIYQPIISISRPIFKTPDGCEANSYGQN